MSDLSCTDYSEKAIVVRGDTKEHKDALKNLGGKYNANLKDGAGWIFSKKNEDKVLAYISSCDSETAIGSSSSTDLLDMCKKKLKTMSTKERLAFIASIADFCAKNDEKRGETSQEPKRSATQQPAKQPPKPVVTYKAKVEQTATCYDSEECEEDAESDEEVPRKRFF
jgi:hypothetical protein